MVNEFTCGYRVFYCVSNLVCFGKIFARRYQHSIKSPATITPAQFHNQCFAIHHLLHRTRVPLQTICEFNAHICSSVTGADFDGA